MLRLVRDEVARLEAGGSTLLGLTVAVPGLIDRTRGRVVEAPNLGWVDVDLAGALSAELGDRVPVAVDNDANCAARAESLHGVAAGVADFVYLTGTVGLGAGIVSGGQVVRGSRGLAGEVGHQRVGDDRPPVRLRTHRLLGGRGRTACAGALDRDPARAGRGPGVLRRAHRQGSRTPPPRSPRSAPRWPPGSRSSRPRSTRR